MKRKVTALLLSAFVLPGLGQFYLGRKLVGGILLVAVNIILLAGLFVMLRGLSPVIAVQIAGGAAGVTQADIGTALASTSAFGKGILASFFLVWTFSIVDVLRAKPEEPESEE
jgi:TM2 domain-containing membrane protein YozV